VLFHKVGQALIMALGDKLKLLWLGVMPDPAALNGDQDLSIGMLALETTFDDKLACSALAYLSSRKAMIMMRVWRNQKVCGRSLIYFCAKIMTLLYEQRFSLSDFGDIRDSIMTEL